MIDVEVELGWPPNLLLCPEVYIIYAVSRYCVILFVTDRFTSQEFTISGYQDVSRMLSLLSLFICLVTGKDSLSRLNFLFIFLDCVFDHR